MRDQTGFPESMSSHVGDGRCRTHDRLRDRSRVLVSLVADDGGPVRWGRKCYICDGELAYLLGD